MFENDLDAKLVLSKKLVNDLKCENESLKMHAKCLIADYSTKKKEVICCNLVVKPDFVPIVNSISKGKSMYIPPHKRNHKVERKALKPKPLFRPYLIHLFPLFREKELPILKKTRMRQLTYGSGAEPQHRGLGQHWYNSQSSIGSKQDGDELQLV